MEIIFPFQITLLLFVIILPLLEINLKILKIIIFFEIFHKVMKVCNCMAMFRVRDDILLYLQCFLFGDLGHAKETTQTICDGKYTVDL